jgi:hypothetical protein
MQRRRRPSDLAQRDVGMLIPRLLEEVGEKERKDKAHVCTNTIAGKGIM